MMPFDILIFLVQATILGLTIFFFWKKLPQLSKKYNYSSILCLINLVSVLLIISQYYFILKGVIIKPLIYIPGIGFQLFLITIFLIFREAIKDRVSKSVSIYVIVISSLTFIFNFVLIFFPFFSYLKMVLFFLFLFHPFASLEKLNGKTLINGPHFFYEGKTEVIDRGWYYERGQTYNIETHPEMFE